MSRFEVFHRDEALPAGSVRVDLRGLFGVVWPPYCVKCGAPTSLRMTVRKIFRRWATGSDSANDVRYEWKNSHWHYVIRKFRIPYCPACIARQEELRDRVSAAHVAFSLLATPLVIPFVGAGFFAIAFYHSLVTETIGTSGQTVGVGIFAALILTMIVSAFSSWRAARFDLVPRTTEITRACQMSDRLGWYDVGFHRVYAFENASYAKAFADANHDRIWTEADRSRLNRRKALSNGVLFAAIAVGAFWLYVLKRK